jgi:hypothetical protein
VPFAFVVSSRSFSTTANLCYCVRKVYGTDTTVLGHLVHSTVITELRHFCFPSQLGSINALPGNSWFARASAFSWIVDIIRRLIHVHLQSSSATRKIDSYNTQRYADTNPYLCVRRKNMA